MIDPFDQGPFAAFARTLLAPPPPDPYAFPAVTRVPSVVPVVGGPLSDPSAISDLVVGPAGTEGLLRSTARDFLSAVVVGSPTLRLFGEALFAGPSSVVPDADALSAALELIDDDELATLLPRLENVRHPADLERARRIVAMWTAHQERARRLGIVGLLTAGFFQPENWLLPAAIPVVRAGSRIGTIAGTAATGAAVGAGVTAGFSALDTLTLPGADPRLLEDIAVGAAFGSVFGGLLGGTVRVRPPSAAAFGREWASAARQATAFEGSTASPPPRPEAGGLPPEMPRPPGPEDIARRLAEIYGVRSPVTNDPFSGAYSAALAALERDWLYGRWTTSLRELAGVGRSPEEAHDRALSAFRAHLETIVGREEALRRSLVPMKSGDPAIDAGGRTFVAIDARLLPERGDAPEAQLARLATQLARRALDEAGLIDHNLQIVISDEWRSGFLRPRTAAFREALARMEEEPLVDIVRQALFEEDPFQSSIGMRSEPWTDDEGFPVGGTRILISSQMLREAAAGNVEAKQMFLAAVAHEVGHAVIREVIAEAPEIVRDAIAKEFARIVDRAIANFKLTELIQPGLGRPFDPFAAAFAPDAAARLFREWLAAQFAGIATRNRFFQLSADTELDRWLRSRTTVGWFTDFARRWATAWHSVRHVAEKAKIDLGQMVFAPAVVSRFFAGIRRQIHRIAREGDAKFLQPEPRRGAGDEDRDPVDWSFDLIRRRILEQESFQAWVLKGSATPKPTPERVAISARAKSPSASHPVAKFVVEKLRVEDVALVDELVSKARRDPNRASATKILDAAAGRLQGERAERYKAFFADLEDKVFRYFIGRFEEFVGAPLRTWAVDLPEISKEGFHWLPPAPWFDFANLAEGPKVFPRTETVRGGDPYAPDRYATPTKRGGSFRFLAHEQDWPMAAEALPFFTALWETFLEPLGVSLIVIPHDVPAPTTPKEFGNFFRAPPERGITLRGAYPPRMLGNFPLGLRAYDPGQRSPLGGKSARPATREDHKNGLVVLDWWIPTHLASIREGVGAKVTDWAHVVALGLAELDLKRVLFRSEEREATIGWDDRYREFMGLTREYAKNLAYRLVFQLEIYRPEEIVAKRREKIAPSEDKDVLALMRGNLVDEMIFDALSTAVARLIGAKSGGLTAERVPFFGDPALEAKIAKAEERARKERFRALAEAHERIAKILRESEDREKALDEAWRIASEAIDRHVLSGDPELAELYRLSDDEREFYRDLLRNALIAALFHSRNPSESIRAGLADLLRGAIRHGARVAPGETTPGAKALAEELARERSEDLPLYKRAPEPDVQVGEVFSPIGTQRFDIERDVGEGTVFGSDETDSGVDPVFLAEKELQKIDEMRRRELRRLAREHWAKVERAAAGGEGAPAPERARLDPTPLFQVKGRATIEEDELREATSSDLDAPGRVRWLFDTADRIRALDDAFLAGTIPEPDGNWTLAMRKLTVALALFFRDAEASAPWLAEVLGKRVDSDRPVSPPAGAAGAIARAIVRGGPGGLLRDMPRETAASVVRAVDELREILRRKHTKLSPEQLEERIERAVGQVLEEPWQFDDARISMWRVFTFRPKSAQAQVVEERIEAAAAASEAEAAAKDAVVAAKPTEETAAVEARPEEEAVAVEAKPVEEPAAGVEERPAAEAPGAEEPQKSEERLEAAEEPKAEEPAPRPEPPEAGEVAPPREPPREEPETEPGKTEIDPWRIRQGRDAIERSLRAIRWRQLPWFVLKNNRFPGTVGSEIALLADRIALNPALELEGNRYGVATRLDSAETRSAQWVGRYVQAEAIHRAAWAESVGAPTPGELRFRLEEIRGHLSTKFPWLRKAIGRPGMTPWEFDYEVRRAIVEGKHENESVMKAARAWRELVLDPLRERAAELGILWEKETAAKARPAIEKNALALEYAKTRLLSARKRVMKRFADGVLPEPWAAATNAIDDLLLSLDRGVRRLRAAIGGEPPEQGPPIPRVWQKGAVRARRATLLAIARRYGERKGIDPIRRWLDVSIVAGDDLPDRVVAVASAMAERAGILSDPNVQRTISELRARIVDIASRVEPSRGKVELASLLGTRLERDWSRGVRDSVLEAIDSWARGVGAGELGEWRAGLWYDLFAGLHRGPFDAADDPILDAWGRNRLSWVPDEALVEFIDPLALSSAAHAVRDLGRALSITELFGEPTMAMEIAELTEKMIDAALAPGAPADLPLEIPRVIEATRQLRDLVLLRAQLPDDPDAISVRVVSFLTSSAIAAQMGASVLSAIPDVGRIVMGVGLSRLLQVWRTHALMPKSWGALEREARAAGAAADLVLLGRFRSLHDLLGLFADRTRIERWALLASEYVQILNLLAPWTELAQRWAGVAFQDELIRVSLALVEGDESVLLRAARYGVDRAFAERIVAAWKAAGSQRVGDLYLAATDEWTDPELVARFRATLKGLVDAHGVIVPTAADSPEFMRTPLGRALFLYRRFAMSATWKIAASALQQRDRMALAGVAAIVALAYVVESLREPRNEIDSASHRLMRAIERSGVVGIFGDVNRALATVTAGAVDVRRAIGAIPVLGDAIDTRPPLGVRLASRSWDRRVAAVVGPAFGPWIVLGARLARDPVSPETVGAIRRMVWGQNVVWWSWAFDAVEGEVRDLVR